MGKYREYIDYLKEKIDSKGNLSDIEKLRLVYIELGRKMDFDLNYVFGDESQKAKLYNRSIGEKLYDRILELHQATCKDLAYLYSDIMKEFGIDVKVRRTTNEQGEIKVGQHVYNEYRYNGKLYTLDLEEDLEFIQTLSKTKYFLKSYDSTTHPDFLNENELRKMDKNVIGYIPEGFYFDDIVYMLKKAVSNSNISLEDKFDFVLYNLDKYTDISGVEYREIANYQARVFNEIFSEKEKEKISRLDGLKIIDGEEKHILILELEKKQDEKIFYVLDENKEYKKLSMEEFEKCLDEGLTTLKPPPGFKKYFKSKQKRNSFGEK